MPISTLKKYVKNHTELREAMFESRSELVDEAELSLRDLVKQKNLTAVIFALKCLGQDRGFIDTPQKNRNNQAPIIINLTPAAPDVRMPNIQVSKGKRKQTLELASNYEREEDIEDAELVELEEDTR
jgi:hypothetical protein